MREPARVLEIPVTTKAEIPELPPDMRMTGKIAAVMPQRSALDPVDIPRESIAALIPPKPKQAGVVVECSPSARELVVSFRDNMICVIKWLPSVQRFLIKRCQELLPNNPKSATWLQHQGGLHEAWQVAGELGVTVEEFQQSFLDMPPEIAWDTKHCPEHRTDCSLAYAGDPRVVGIPDLACRTCHSRFSMKQSGELVLIGREAGAVIPDGSTGTLPQPPRPQVPFEKDLVRYQGMGRAKLDKLQEAGIRSWSDVIGAGAEKIARLPGFSEKTAEMLVEIAQEKV